MNYHTTLLAIQNTNQHHARLWPHQLDSSSLSPPYNHNDTKDILIQCPATLPLPCCITLRTVAILHFPSFWRGCLLNMLLSRMLQYYFRVAGHTKLLLLNCPVTDNGAVFKYQGRLLTISLHDFMKIWFS